MIEAATLCDVAPPPALTLTSHLSPLTLTLTWQLITLPQLLAESEGALAPEGALASEGALAPEGAPQRRRSAADGPRLVATVGVQESNPGPSH